MHFIGRLRPNAFGNRVLRKRQGNRKVKNAEKTIMQFLMI